MGLLCPGSGSLLHIMDTVQDIISTVYCTIDDVEYIMDTVRHCDATVLASVLQVLGITNYSHWGDAGQLRSCVWDSSHAHDLLEQVALKRIQRFLHVGTTDRLFDSAASAAVRG